MTVTRRRRAGRGRAAIVVCAVVLGGGWVAPARAQPRDSAQSKESDGRRRASELSKAALECYRRADYGCAVEGFEHAWELHQEPLLLYNLAKSYEGRGDARSLEGTGDLRSAVDHYRRYLERRSSEPTEGEPTRAMVDAKIAALEKKVADLERLVRERADARTGARPEPRPASPAAGRSPSPLPWIVAGVGAGGVAAGAVVWALAAGRHDDASSERVGTEAARLEEGARDLATAGNVAFVAGVGLLAAGVIWGAVDRAGAPGAPAAGAPRISVRVGVLGVAIAGAM